MKKYVSVQILLLTILLIFPANLILARDIYVSHTQTGTGSGTMSDPYSITALFSNVINVHPGTDTEINIYFQRGGSYSTGHFAFGSNNGFNSANWNGKTVTFDAYDTGSPVILDGSGQSNIFVNLSFDRPSGVYFTLNVKNIIIQNFTANNTNHFIYINGNRNNLNLESVTIRNCDNTNSSSNLLYINNGYSTLNISNSSIINNTRGATSLILSTYNGSSNIYNNTFSNNVGQTIRFNTTGCNVYNNTFYNTGRINLSAAVRFMNNIAMRHPVPSANASADNTYYGTFTNCHRNIQTYAGQIYVNVTGNTDGINVTTNFEKEFDRTLSGTLPGRQVHQVKNTGNNFHSILSRGLTPNELSSPSYINSNLPTDQLGNERPTSTRHLSLGSIDARRYIFKAKPINIKLYLPAGSVTPVDTVIDLSKRLVSCPIDNITPGNSTYTLTDTLSSYGAFELNGSSLKFTSPMVDGVLKHGKYLFTYSVSRTVDNVTYESKEQGEIHLSKLGVAPGYIDPNDFPETCFDYMGAVKFTSKTNFATNKVNTDAPRQYGFSIPLAGDLNGDGYPEIIANSVSGTSGGGGSYTGIAIFNGQTGKLISQIDYPNGGTYTSDGSHGSPSNMSLVDSDRDGTVELIVAFPGGGSSTYRDRLVSFDIEYDKGSDSYSLKQRWISSEEYNADLSSSYRKGFPQIVDIDGDGTPEVIVYNRVYNAVNGKLLLTIDPSSAYVGIDKNANGADTYVNFSYVYDLDLDGNYDLAAGGKLYQLTKNLSGNFVYNTIECSGIPDGRTGVADINGDGIPDIVVVTREGAGSYIRVVVWNPGFFEMNGNDPTRTPVLNNDGSFKRNTTPDPYIMADITLRMTKGGAGSNSYVYIGDIDGLEQTIDGKTYRLPEISVLSGTLARSGNSFTGVEVHPNIPSNSFSSVTSRSGEIVSLTWDADPLVKAVDKKLKLSFVLEHKDRSQNTGFTLFDFDNDGMKEICYRDEETLRIIKASKPHVKTTETDTENVLLFSQKVTSFTGYELPIIADINNDASAEMIVIGHQDSGDRYYGYVFSVGYGTGDKFAPALPVWNQFMYSPFKINPDLTTPIGPALNPLDKKYTYKQIIKKDNQPDKVITIQPYNGTLAQAPYYNLRNGDEFEPIVFLTDAYIIGGEGADGDRPKIVVHQSNAYIEMTVGNGPYAKTDVSLNTPIAIYEDEIKAPWIKKTTLGDVFIAGSTTENLGGAIKAGETKRIWIPVDQAYMFCYVRLGDDSDNEGSIWKWRFGTNNGQGSPGSGINPPEDPRDGYGIGIASRSNRDCNWTDQSVKVSLAALNTDAVTVQQYSSVKIDIFANDDFPSDFPAADANFAMSSQYIVTSPSGGTLNFSGKNVIYTHTGPTPADNVDMFTYGFKYKPQGATQERLFTGNVYIYIMEPEVGGMGTCYGNNFTTKLKESPEGIRFIWFNDQDQEQTTADSLTIDFGAIISPKTYQVQPLLSFYNGERVNFSRGDLTVDVIGDSSGTNVTMKWIGTADTNWKNPNNWIALKNNVEIPVTYIPTNCTDVIISSGALYYPELGEDALCNNITVEDRGMIAGIHYLTYSSAKVELKLKPSERDRFVMWSAPLKSVYSGDYHFKNNNAPQWGDVYMNLFQHDNPAGGAAKANMFTATFGEMDQLLELGTAFNVKVYQTGFNQDKGFVFPQSATSYTTSTKPGVVFDTPRFGKGDRFITDGVTLNADRTFNLPVNGEAGYNLIQVVNPYLAYLDVRAFLAANDDADGVSPGYMIWNGDVNSDFVTVLYEGSSDYEEGMRYKVGTAPTLADTPDYIAPLQSFFVAKKNLFSSTTSLKMSPDWTTTTVPSAQGDYVLTRSGSIESNALRIEAIQGSKTSQAVLYYDFDASPGYDAKEDLHKIFYKGLPLSVYSLTPSGEPLAINSNGNYNQETILGLRLKEPGEVTLDFSGMETFGHDVYLIDTQAGNGRKEIDLQKTRSYTFTVAQQPAGDDFIEINNRFELRMVYTGIGVGTEDVDQDAIRIFAEAGRIYIKSTSASITDVKVYTVDGVLVYGNTAVSDQYTIDVENRKNYIIKVKYNGQEKVEKLFVN